jgi:hypothetical protein
MLTNTMISATYIFHCLDDFHCFMERCPRFTVKSRRWIDSKLEVVLCRTR